MPILILFWKSTAFLFPFLTSARVTRFPSSCASSSGCFERMICRLDDLREYFERGQHDYVVLNYVQHTHQKRKQRWEVTSSLYPETAAHEIHGGPNGNTSRVVKHFFNPFAQNYEIKTGWQICYFDTVNSRNPLSFPYTEEKMEVWLGIGRDRRLYLTRNPPIKSLETELRDQITGIWYIGELVYEKKIMGVKRCMQKTV